MTVSTTVCCPWAGGAPQPWNPSVENSTHVTPTLGPPDRPPSGPIVASTSPEVGGPEQPFDADPSMPSPISPLPLSAQDGPASAAAVSALPAATPPNTLPPALAPSAAPTMGVNVTAAPQLPKDTQNSPLA